MYFEFSYVCSPKYFYSNQRSLHSTWQTPSCHVKLRGVKDSAEESDSAVFKILSYYIQIMNESWDQMSLNQEKTKAKTFKHLLIPRCQRHRRRFLHMQISPRNLKHIWKYFSIFNKLSGRLENEEKKYWIISLYAVLFAILLSVFLLQWNRLSFRTPLDSLAGEDQYQTIRTMHAWTIFS